MPSLSISRTLACALLFWVTGASAQVADSTGFFPEAPMASDSLIAGPALPDSATLADSLGKKRVPAFIGSFDRLLDSSSVVTTSGKHRVDFRYAGDLLSSFPGTFPLEQSSEGQYSTVAFRGVDWRGLFLALDGRGANDPASGVSNLYWAAVDYVERIEIVSGPRSFLYGLNASGAAVNFVTRNYNSNRPLSAITYSEAGSGYTLADGTYSQNVTRRFNLTAGFQARNTEGRYPNSLHESWNGRVKLRYHLTDDLLLFLTEYFTSSFTELNGGVDFEASGPAPSFVPVQAVMVNTDAYEKVTRHELAMTLAGTLLGDTAHITSLSFYYAHNLREYRDEENRPSPNGVFIQSDHTSSWMGAQLRQNITTRGQSFELGADLELRQVEGSPNIGRRRNVIGTVWGKEEVSPWDPLRLAGYARYDRYLDADYAGFGADVRFRLLEPLAITVGASRFRRLPSYTELYWTDSTVSRTGTIGAEKHLLIEAGADFRLSDFLSARVSYSRRTVDDAIGIVSREVTSPFPAFAYAVRPRLTTDCVEAGVWARVWVLTLEGTGQFIEQRDGDGQRLDALPKYWLSGGLYFDDALVQGKLALKAGFRGRLLASYQGDRFNAEVPAYVPNTGSPVARSGSLDLVVLAHLGDAYIHFTWENLTDAGYFLIPYYPDQDRQVRFGISWQFID